MKRISLLLLYIIVFLAARKVHSQCTGCSSTINLPAGTTVNSTVTPLSNQTICFTGTGSFGGSIEFNNANNVTICLPKGATFLNTSGFNNVGSSAPGCKVINYGTWKKDLGSVLLNEVDFVNYGTVTTAGFNMNTGNKIDNYSLITITGSVTANSLGSLTTYNGSTINISGNLDVPSGGGIYLGGIINVAGNATVQANASIIGTPPGCAGLTIGGVFTNTSGGTVGGSYGVWVNKKPNPDYNPSGTTTSKVNTGGPPSTTTPANKTICAGSTATFAVTATSSSTPTYQWQVNSGSGFTDIANNATYSGATTNTLSVITTNTALQGYQYRVIVTACPYPVISGAATLTVYAIPSATVTSANVTGCNGNNNGAINITNAINGGGTYQFSKDNGTNWGGSGTNYNFTSLGPGTYPVRIRDAANISCAASLTTVTITQPVVLNATVASSPVTGCNGGTNGKIDVSGPSGGSGTYQYSKDNGITWTSTASSYSFTNLGAGSYTLKIKDAGNPSCTATLGTYNITQPLPLSATVTTDNVTGCYGNKNGSISIAGATGGSGSYNYTINAGANWTANTGASYSFPNLGSGTYNVQMRDGTNSSCVKILNTVLVITEPTKLGAFATPTDVSGCYGNNNGSLNITGTSGGSQIYEYSKDGGSSWVGNGGSTSNNFTGLGVGNYILKVRDATVPSCEINVTTVITISQPAKLSANVTATPVTSCYGNSNGTINITSATGGSGSYQYSKDGGLNWTGSGTNFIFSALPGATYDVRIRDANNPLCIVTLNSSLAVTQPALLKATVTPTMVTQCYGNNNGAINITGASGGSGNYEYTINGSTWTGSGTSNNFTPLAAGTYNVKIRDGLSTGCVVTLNPALNITQPAILNASVSSTPVSTCAGNHDGSITISSPAGGSGNYQFSKDGGSSWSSTSNAQSYSNLTAGSYSIKIKDATNTSCVITLNSNLVITEPFPLVANVVSTNTNGCSGTNNGSINITNATGGSGTYQYSKNGGGTWSGSGTSFNFTNLSAGTYDVRIKDAAKPSCVVILNNALIINQPTAITANKTFTDVTGCYGSSNGQIIISGAAGGSGSYQFSKDNGVTWTGSGTGITFSSLTATTYSIKVRDAANPACMVTLTPAITITQPALITATATANPVSGCYGSNNGSIDVTGASGGSGTYQFTKDGGSTWSAAGVNISYSPLAAGNYNVKIRDAVTTSCVITLNAALPVTQPVAMSASITPTNVTGCTGASNGSILISNPTGGSGSYEYTIKGGTVWYPAGNFTNLFAGIYNVQIRDASNISCVKILTPTIILSETASLSATVSSANVSLCSGNGDGSIKITGATGGSGDFNFSRDGGATWQGTGTSWNFFPVDSGSYHIKIRDANATSCETSLDPALYIDDFPVMDAPVSHTDVTTCRGLNNGSISIGPASGGSGTYEYSINGGFSWATSPVFNNLIAKNYNIRVRDKATPACKISLDNNYTISQPDSLKADLGITHISTCYGNDDGEINIESPSGGSGSYEYTINGGANWIATSTFINLSAGNYQVQLRDKINPTCIVTLYSNLTLTQPALLNATVNITDVNGCNGNNSGSIAINGAAGGSGTYHYSIDGGGQWSSNNVFNNLSAGTYNIVLRDASNTSCIQTLFAVKTLTEPQIIAANMITTDVTDCNGNNNGTIVISSATGGSGDYNYSIDGGNIWTGSGNGHSFTGLMAGTYNVKVRDAANPSCIATLNNAVILNEPGLLAAATSVSAVTGCYGSSNGTIHIISATGGSGNFEFSRDGGNLWEGTGTNYDFAGLSAGNYNVMMHDKDFPACKVTLKAALAVTQPVRMSATLTPTNVSGCNGNTNGTIAISNADGGSGTYEYSKDGGVTWEGTGSNYTFANLSANTYSVMIKDAANISCIIVLDNNVNITQANSMTAQVNVTPVTICKGNNNGRIDITNSAGGGGTYEYSINGGSFWRGTGDFADLSAGTYNVLIRDANYKYCSTVINNSVKISEPTAISATYTSNNVTTCYGNNNGSISISGAAGGSGTYEYSIDSTWSNQYNYTGLYAGTYFLKVRDALNKTCIVDLKDSLKIAQPDILYAEVDSSNVTGCSGNTNGSINISSPKGGSGTYNYSVDNGSSWQPTGNFSGLKANYSYHVLIQDAANLTCFKTLRASLKLSEPAAIKADVSANAVSGCFGNSNGSININNIEGGSGSYGFSIDNGVKWENSKKDYIFDSLAYGTYSIMVRDAATPATCFKVLSAAITVSQPVQISSTVSQQNITDCHGSSNGSILLKNTAGGNGLYQYSKDGGVTWEGSGVNYTFTNIKAGNYNLRIRDSVSPGCYVTIANPFVITEPDSIVATVVPTNITDCFGRSSGKIEIKAATGGSNSFGYSIDGGVNWETSTLFSNLSVGYYKIKIRDDAYKTCIVLLKDSLYLSQPDSLKGTANRKNPRQCNTAADGEIHVTNISGGSGVYEYSITGGTSWQASPDFTSLSAGFYNVNMRDGDPANQSCTLTLNPGLRLTTPAALSGTAAPTPILSCKGIKEGVIHISPKGGSGIYHFSIDNGSTWSKDSVFTKLAAATYNVVIRDSLITTCIATLNASLIIEEPTGITASVVANNVTGCNNANNGSISVNASGGNASGYLYSLDSITFKPMNPVTGLRPGIYKVYVQDKDHTNCIVTVPGTFPITEPAILSADTIIKAVSGCYGKNNGQVEFINAAGGSGAFEFSINGYQFFDQKIFPNLTFGYYKLRMRDFNSRTCLINFRDSILLGQPQQIKAKANVVDVLDCHGSNTGVIKISNTSGGSGKYNYTINNGANWSSSPVFSNLGAATYTIIIRDSLDKTCKIVLDTNHQLKEPTLLSGTVSTNPVINCYGDSTGGINIAALGGSNRYNYSIDGGNTWQAANVFPKLPSGSYEVTVRDSLNKNCTVLLDGNYALTEPKILNATATSADVTVCHGLNNGTITLSNPSGGSNNYEYSINNNDDWISVPLFANLSAGTYKVTMRDARHLDCRIALPGTLLINQPDSLIGKLSFTNVTSCFGNTNGQINVINTSGGSGVYEYTVNNGKNWSSNASYSTLSAGTYQVKMRDKQHAACVLVLDTNFTITQPLQLAAEYTSNMVSGCQGNDNGVITFNNVVGGSKSYEYSINDGKAWYGTARFNNLVAGKYRLLLRDGIYPNCVKVIDDSASITHPDPLMPPQITQQPSPQGPICEKTGNPAFTIGATGAGISYQWRENDIDISDNATYKGSGSPELTIVSPNSPFNGRGYKVVVTGTCGTVTSASALLTIINGSYGGKLTASEEICANSSVQNMKLTGQNGNILRWEMKTASSGWTPVNITTPSYNPGTLSESTRYRVAVRNGNCPESASSEVMKKVYQYPSLANAGEDQAVCGPQTSLKATAPAVGQGKWTIDSGLGGTLAEDTLANTIFKGVETAVYNLIWKVSNGPCQASQDTVQLLLNPAVNLFVTPSQEVKIGTPVQLEATGGATYQWESSVSLSNTDISNPVATPKYTTTYHVKASNPGGCTDTASVTLTAKGVFIPMTFSPNDDGIHDKWIIQNVYNYPYAVLEVFNRWGQVVANLLDAKSIEAGWDGKNKGADLPVGTYFYVLQLDDKTILNGSITLLR